MTAAELREALTVMTVGYLLDDDPDEVRVLIDAARTIALPLLEADPELVERIAHLLRRAAGADSRHYNDPVEWFFDDAREVLTAISTPTPVEEM